MCIVDEHNRKQLGYKMKTEYIRIRTTPKRFNKLKLLAEEREVSMTRLIEDMIDIMPEPRNNAPKGATHS
jgi:hypothetical protein